MSLRDNREAMNTTSALAPLGERVDRGRRFLQPARAG